MEDKITLFRAMLSALTATLLDFFYPIKDFLLVIAVFATVNIIFGALADTDKWRFKKAFKAFIYLIGYMCLLLLSFSTGDFMQQTPETVANFTSWITWVMIYFYAANILRNWNIRQPDNRVIEFLYWVVTFKVIDKIDFLSEFLKQKKDGGNK